MPADQRAVLREKLHWRIADEVHEAGDVLYENARRAADAILALPELSAALSAQHSGGERERALEDTRLASALHLILLDDGATGSETRLRWSDRDVLKKARDRLNARAAALNGGTADAR